MSLAIFDLADLADAVEAAEEQEPQEPLADLKTWAEQQLADHSDRDRNPVVFDIETGPRPLDEIESFYQPPEALPPWDESMVRYGNAKREELRAEKREEHKKAYQMLLDAEGAALIAHKTEWLSKAALSPVTGRVLLIGTLGTKTGKQWYIDLPDEARCLEAVWAFMDECLSSKTPLIGHNSNSFDLPFLVRRSWALGVTVLREVRQGRYWNPLFLDTMEHWNCGQREYVSLNTLGAFFGVGQKTEGVAGGDFAKLWFGTPEERAKAIEYNGQDLKLTAAIAAKMGMV